MARTRNPPRWRTIISNNWVNGMMRDTSHTGIPPGFVYNAYNCLLYKPGVAFKRGGIVQGSQAASSGASLIAVAYGSFPGIGNQQVIVSNTGYVDEVTEAAKTAHGQITGFTNIIDPPTLWVGGAVNALIFTDSTGNVVPWYYDGQNPVSQFQGGNAGATGTYALSITGSPTGGNFKLAAQDLQSGFAYTTANIAYNASAATVESALEAAAPNTFACTGGVLPGTPVSIVVPTDWAVSVVPPTIAGTALTGGSSPYASLGAVGGSVTGVPTAIHSCFHLNHLILANSSQYPNRLWFGPVLNPLSAAWDTDESWIDMDRAVSGMASLSNVLLVFSYETMWRIVGDSPPPDSNMDIQPIGHVGCTDARSIVTWEGRCIFANPRGVYATTGVGYENLMQDRIESYWQGLFSGYTPSGWTISCGLFGRRFLFVTVLNGTTIVDVLICDLPRKAWVRSSQPAARMYAHAFGTQDELFAATPNYTYSLKCSGVFAPTSSNKNDAAGAVTLQLETGPVAYSPALKAFGDAHIAYDMRDAASDNPTLRVQIDPRTEGDAGGSAPNAAESPLVETSDYTRSRVTVSRDAQAVYFLLTQSNASSRTEVYSIEVDVRPYWLDAEVT